MVADPAATVSRLAEFLELPTFDLLSAPAPKNAPIGTASRWQARQPVYRSSVGAWRSYAPLVPELERYFPDTAA